jgi:hypothetical protein
MKIIYDNVLYLILNACAGTLAGVERIMDNASTKTRPPPCPFCGRLSWRYFRDAGTWATQVECAGCGARGPLCIPSQEAALAAWSERAKISGR